MSELAKKQCKPCQGGVPPLSPGEIAPLAEQVPEWEVVDYHHLERTFDFADFAQALEMVNRLATAAESQGHHPDIFLTWGQVRVQWWTHKIQGLSDSDFIMAAKTDLIYKGFTAKLRNS